MLPSCLDLVFLHWISGRSFMLGKAIGSRALPKLCLHSSYRLVCPYFGNALNLVLYPTLKKYSQHCVYRRFFHYTHLSFARQFLKSRLDHLTFICTSLCIPFFAYTSRARVSQRLVVTHTSMCWVWMISTQNWSGLFEAQERDPFTNCMLIN